MRAAIYCRKSTPQKGRAEQDTSVALQERSCRDYATSNGWAVLDDHVYKDDRISGAEFDRRVGLQRMMAAATSQPRPFDVLVMTEESRLGRELVETTYLLKQLIVAGVRVFVVSGDRELKLSTSMERVQVAMASYASDVERENAGARSHRALAAKARAGRVAGGRTFGYRNIDVAGGVDHSGRAIRSHVERVIHEEEASCGRSSTATRVAGVWRESPKA